MAADDVIFILTKEDVIQCCKELDMPELENPEELVTDDFLYKVRKGVEFGLECWSEVMKEAIIAAIKG